MSVFDILVKFRFEIIQSIFCGIMPLSLWIRSSKLPFMIIHSFGNINIFSSSRNIWVSSKWWDWVVYWMTKWLFNMIGNASSRSTNWIGFSLSCKLPMMIKSLFSFSQIRMSIFDILIKFRFKVILSIFCRIMPLSLCIRSSKLPFMIVHSFSNINVISSTWNIWVSSKWWDWVINWISEWLFNMIRNASSRSANWIWLWPSLSC